MQLKPYTPPAAPRNTARALRMLHLWFAAFALVVWLGLSGCGLETAATAAATAEPQAQQAQVAQQPLDAVKQQLEQATALLEARKQQMGAAAQ